MSYRAIIVIALVPNSSPELEVIASICCRALILELYLEFECIFPPFLGTVCEFQLSAEKLSRNENLQNKIFTSLLNNLN